MSPTRKRVLRVANLGLSLLILLALILAAGCSMGKRTTETANTNATNQPATNQPQPSNQPPASSDSAVLQPGQASGSYTAKGEKVDVKYAYAGRGERFGSDAVIVLVTDKPIPPEAVEEELKDQTLLGDQKIRGLEYVFMQDGYWVRFHPSQYQESRSGEIKEYAIEADTVRGRDEGDSSLTDGKYSRSVRFAAQLPKK
jgi:hypothetical protein